MKAFSLHQQANHANCILNAVEPLLTLVCSWQFSAGFNGHWLTDIDIIQIFLKIYVDSNLHKLQTKNLGYGEIFKKKRRDVL